MGWGSWCLATGPDTSPSLTGGSSWATRDRSPLRVRVDAFTGLVERLTFGRPEMVEEFVVLGGGAIIELRLIPPLLAAS